ncbi:kinase-like domain-containing protein, partial [Peziza echinospora]
MPTLALFKKKKKDKESQRPKESSSTSSSILQKEDHPVDDPPTPTVPVVSTLSNTSQVNSIGHSSNHSNVNHGQSPTVSQQIPSPSNPSNASAPSPLPPPEPMALVSDRPMISEQGQYQTVASSATHSSQPHTSNINNLINPPQQAQDYPRYYETGTTSQQPQQQQQQPQQQQQQPSQQPQPQQAAQPNQQAGQQNATPADTQSTTANNGGNTAGMSTEQGEKQTQAATVTRTTRGKYSLSDFTIQRTLGTGSFGRVHLVQSRHNLRFYAVKVLKKAQVVKMKQVEHTNDERKMLQKVKHPFLITLWGTFQDSKNLYMVMDFIEGGELFSLLRKSQRFPNPVAKFYAAEVTLALEYLHAHHIIYRDLKPENLLLDRHGHLKITDFGFAKEVPDITWTLCGTPDYLHLKWSLGILIFEMLCGYTPFYDGGSPLRIYENILKGNPKYPAFIHPDAKDLLT